MNTNNLTNLQRCIDGYGRQDISAEKLVRTMTSHKRYVEHRAKNTPRYLTSLMIVKDQVSVICGIHVASHASSKGDLNVVVLPSVKVLYIVSQTSTVERVVLYAPRAVTVECIYSNIPVVLHGVTCTGQLVVPKDTTVSKSTMEKSGWLHYYSPNTDENQAYDPYQLDFLHICSNRGPGSGPGSGSKGFDFYFRKHGTDQPLQLPLQHQPDSLSYYPYCTNETWVRSTPSTPSTHAAHRRH
jgi:hypothetical protein